MKPGGAKKVRPVRMFVSYSHENAAWCKRLLPVLRVKANVDILQPWHDTELKAGDRWDKEIRAELERMDIFLCLVSFHFLPVSCLMEPIPSYVLPVRVIAPSAYSRIVNS